MTNHLKTLALTTAILVTMTVADVASAIAINRCVRIVRDPQVNRETIVNTCKICRTVKVSRQRPGSATGVPTMRDLTLLPGTSQLLPFRGPGSTRIHSDAPCPSVQK